MNTVNSYFQTVFRTFLKHKNYIDNALVEPYSKAKLEATNKLIKDIKRQGFGFRDFLNFKKRVFISLNIKKRKDKYYPFSLLIFLSHTTVDKEPKKIYI